MNGGGADCGNFTDFLVNMSASADILAQAKVEIDLKAIPEGKNVRISSSLIYFEMTLGKLGAKKKIAGDHQMARQTSLHPPPDRRRDQRSGRRTMGIAT